VVAIDGTKLSANASVNANRDFGQIAREILEEAAETDRREDELYGRERGDELPEHLRTREGRRKALREAKQRLERERQQAAEWVAPDVVQTRIAGCRRGAIPAMTAWPDRDFRDLHPVNGYRLAPADTPAGRDGVALVFVMNIKTPGRHAVPAVDVTYHIWRHPLPIAHPQCVRRLQLHRPRARRELPRTARLLTGAGARRRRRIAPAWRSLA